MQPPNASPTYSPTGNTDREDRLREVQDWDIEEAKQRAKLDGIDFSVDHLAVLTFLRKFYVDHGWPKNTHELIKVLDKEFEKDGGKKYLHRLFPEGPIAQASRLAGLPTPSNAIDTSFGSTY
ncbi:MAG: TusE/DsrC/DsvC family sulfur relay protein [Thioalkalispiraceae bacterium]|jgi:tRNA 2-thiouridine synthesizing protein E